MTKNTTPIITALKFTLLGLVVLLPLALPLSIWLGSHTSIIAVSAWKELVLLMTIPPLTYVLAVDKNVLRHLSRDRSIQLSAVLILLYSITALVGWWSIETLAGLAIATRFLYVYILARLVGYYDKELWRTAGHYLVTVTVFVAVTAIAQVALLPKDLLTHIGYDAPGNNTQGVPPAYHLISGSSFVRAQATLRGPNVLGAFLILPMTLVIVWLQSKTARQNKQLAYGLLGVMGMALFLSYSRSAWLGLIVAAIVTVFCLNKWRWTRDKILTIGIIGLVGSILFAAVLDSGIGRSLLLHADPKSGASISNQGHLYQSTEAVKEIIKQPLGGGVGTAGPASALESESRIAENYFLQIGQEVGLVGLVLFVWLTGYMAVYFYRQRHSRIAIALLASLAGLTLCSLLLHTWTEEAVAMIWWILAGLAYESVILDKKRKHDDKTKTRSA